MRPAHCERHHMVTAEHVRIDARRFMAALRTTEVIRRRQRLPLGFCVVSAIAHFLRTAAQNGGNSVVFFALPLAGRLADRLAVFVFPLMVVSLPVAFVPGVLAFEFGLR